ncbi:YaeF family permuted papain-like enzyme [Variovorax guangxiensis]|uniref:YaeF family permuted papain-like enzyme n=1 Tax=Variovorax guangxiensis TaxID=1775474 RepID=A0A502DZZ6_9BURK|nr:YaeF family permuted papain-like enzyme [Variovorax guangxiensis]TPG27195.1 YaeF family permuted papain-like enzyme [Variovorax ginsengisoli]TPG30923.1 YaeF family permuted papain-like enzyme [Variovorax guangxiensis]
MNPARRLGAIVLLAATLLTGCASRFERSETDGLPRLNVQSSAIAPGNGGELIAPAVLEPGDILLTSVATLGSFGIRLGTFSPVSHAVLYLGDGQVAEAVGDGVRARRIEDVVAEEQMVVAFRHPGIDAAHAERLRDWALAQVGTRYNTVGVLLNAPFVLNRRVCELPLIPGPAREFCLRGFAMVQLGASRDDQFFCSQFVLEAYNQAGLPVTTADPRWVSPADLLHMREGDVPSIPATQPLRYVGHLKYNPPPVITADGAVAR